jgi:hypothetical protein
MAKRATLTDELCCKHKVRICWRKRTFTAKGTGESLQTERYLGMSKAKSVAERVRIASLGNIEAWAEVHVGNGPAGEIWNRVDLPGSSRNG